MVNVCTQRDTRYPFFCSFRGELIEKAILSCLPLEVGWKCVSLRLMPRSHGTPFEGRHVAIDGKYFSNTMRTKELLLDWPVAMELKKKETGREIL